MRIVSYVDKYLYDKGRKVQRANPFFQDKQTDKNAKRVIRAKRDQTEDHYATTLGEEMDFFQVIRDRNVTTAEVEATKHLGKTQATYMQYDTYEYGQETTSEETRYISNVLFTKKSTLADTASPDEEPYDYEKFKMEYEQQLDYDIKRGKVLNYTEKKEDTPKKALERILDLKRPKNCTKEELSQIGIKAIECLVYDYRRAKDVATMQKVLSRTWLVLRVWLLIYVCLAIPCWCQRGKLSIVVFSEEKKKKWKKNCSLLIIKKN